MKKIILTAVVGLCFLACKKEQCKQVTIYTITPVPPTYSTIKKDTSVNNELMCGAQLESALKLNLKSVQIPYGNGFYTITTIVVAK